MSIMSSALDDDYVRNRIIKSLPYSGNKDLAIECAKGGHISMLKVLSDDERLSVSERIECLSHITDNETKLYLLRDILSHLIDYPSVDGIDELLSSISVPLVKVADSLDRELTLCEALETVDSFLEREDKYYD